MTGAARFAGDIEARGLLHGAPGAGPAGPRADRADRRLGGAGGPRRRRGPDRRRPADRHRGDATGSTSRSPGARSCGRASRSRSSSPRRPRPPRTRPRSSMVETTPLEPVLDLDRAIVARRAAGARSTGRSTEAGATGESQHAAVGGGAEEFTPDEAVSDNVVARSGYRRGDVDAALAAQRRRRRGPVRDELGPPGLHRAAGRDGRARRRRRPPPHERDAGHVLHPLRAVASCSACRSPRSG